MELPVEYLKTNIVSRQEMLEYKGNDISLYRTQIRTGPCWIFTVILFPVKKVHCQGFVLLVFVLKQVSLTLTMALSNLGVNSLGQINYMYDASVSRSADSPNVIETALDLGARFLVPLRDSDMRSVTFGFAALIISSIASFISDYGKDENELNNIDINISNAIENRNGESKDKLFFYQNDLNKLNPISEKEDKEKPMSTSHLNRAMRAYEAFMAWAKKQTRGDKIIIEDLLELAVLKARGTGNPADQLYKHGGEIISYMAGSIVGFATSWMWWDGFV